MNSRRRYKARLALGLLGLLIWTAQAGLVLRAGDAAADDIITNVVARATAEVEAAVSNATEQARQAGAGVRIHLDEATGNAVRAARERPAVRTRGNAVVAVGGHAELKEGETAEAVVAIGGNATVHGTVQDAVVAILGNVEISGTVGDAVVAVMGDVRLLPGAKVRGEVVTVGGTIHRSEDAEIGGEVQEVNLGALQLPKLEWLQAWFKECVLQARPLSLGVGWVWWVAGAFLLLYGLVALALPRPVEACVQEFTRQPATTLLVGLLAKLLIPFVSLVLLATGLGLFVLPFFWAATWIAAILGKAALLVYLGRQLTRQFVGGTAAGTLLALGLGWLLVTALYLVPVLGLLVFAVTGIWALGGAVMATLSGAKREREPTPIPATGPASPLPPSAAVTEPTAPAPPFAPASPSTVPPVAAAPSTAPGPAISPAAPLPSAPGPMAPPPMPTAVLPEALALPRAGFWERIGAGFLDLILVGILGGLVGGPPWIFLVALAYFAGMWAWRGTTVGGVVLKLKVVRLDGQPVSFAVALVRGLAAAFSMVVFFLGFLWIAWDADKQGWHDKIAGTVVVRLPRTQSLVCY